MSLSRSAFAVAADLVSVRGPGLGVGEAAMRIRPGDGRPARRLGDVAVILTRPGLGHELGGQVAALIALGQDGDRQIRAVALTEAATDAIGGFDDRVMRQDQAVLRADLDADVAALAPVVYPTDIDEVDNGRGAVGAFLGGIWRSRGCSPDSVECPRVRVRDTKST
jgi:hypothetical protein